MADDEDGIKDELEEQRQRLGIGEMAADAEQLEADEQAEMFPLGSIDGDPNVTLKTLVKAGHDVKTTVSLGSAEVPAPKGGLLNPEKEGMLLVTFEVAGYAPVPEREGDRHTGKKIKGWKIRQTLRPIYVERVSGEAGAIEANFSALLNEDEQAAGALLDTLKERLAAKLADGKHPSRYPSGAAA